MRILRRSISALSNQELEAARHHNINMIKFTDRMRHGLFAAMFSFAVANIWLNPGVPFFSTVLGTLTILSFTNVFVVSIFNVQFTMYQRLLVLETVNRYKNAG